MGIPGGQLADQWHLAAQLSLAAASHGVLDIFTNGGLAVALWWPWPAERWFSPWQVNEVPPLPLQRLLSPRGLAVLLSELRGV
jgi:inner membrane protein